MAGSSAISLVNAGVEGFVRAAALDIPRGIRINVVSPGWGKEIAEKMGRDGSRAMPASLVARAYVEAIEGGKNGETIEPSGAAPP